MISAVAYNFNNYVQPSLYSKRVRFCGSSNGLEKLDSAITKYLEKDKMSLLDRLKFHLMLMKNLCKLTQKENYISEGIEAVVYRISDAYVSRHKKCSKNDKLKISLVHKVENPFADIKSYYGAPLFESGYMTILRNAIQGKFVSCGTPLHINFAKPTEQEIYKYEKEYIPLCASLPQKSYDLLVSDVKKLGDRGFSIDSINPENIMITDNKFRIVDELDKSMYNVTLFDVLKILMLKYSQMFYAKPKPELFEARKEIFRKSLIAGEKVDMRFGCGLLFNEDAECALEKILYNSITGICSIFNKLYCARKIGAASLQTRIDMINQHFKNSNIDITEYQDFLI